MTNAEAVLYKTIEDLVLGYNESKEKGEDALQEAIRILDQHIAEQQYKSAMPLWIEICQQYRLDESANASMLAGIFRIIANKCQILEVTEWLNAEADLAEFQHE